MGAIALSIPGISSADALGEALTGCVGIANDGDRLKCFDAVAAKASRGPDDFEPDSEEESTAAAAVGTAIEEVKPANQPDLAEAVAVGAGPDAAELASESANVAAAAGTSTAQSSAVPLSDDVGLERVKGAEREKTPEYAAVVTRCERNPQTDQMYFYLENGQVWKQSNYRRLNYRDCRFEVTLRKDGFGYKLYIPSKDRNVRVNRLR